MKIPKIEKLPSGSYFCRLRLNGESIPITEDSYDKCQAKALAIKQGLIQGHTSPSVTLRKAIDLWISERYNVLSPATIRGYRTIQRRLPDRPIKNIKWQRLIDDLASYYAPKTVANTWGLIRTVLKDYDLDPNVRLPQKTPREPVFLTPEQIPVFIDAIKDTPYVLPALLALNSLRLSEIKALTWKDIGKEFITVHGSVVPDEHNVQTRKTANKTLGSRRSVPILIPELHTALEEKRDTGPLMPCDEALLRKRINRVCRNAGLPEVSIHGLRHSFASLAYHLQVPSRITMEIGGWSNEQTVMRIYTHIAKSDIDRYTAGFRDFFKR